MIQQRFKDSVPFSQRLNDWLQNWYDSAPFKVVFTDVDDFDNENPEQTFKKHLNRFQENNEIHVWTGGGSKTIYGTPKINLIARAWHDYIHYANELNYSTLSEIEVGAIQSSMLPEGWDFEKQLIQADVTGQILYHNKYGGFPEDQRKFVINYLKYGMV